MAIPLSMKRGEIVLIVLLALLNFVPIGAGLVRLSGLDDPTPENARFIAAPVVTVLHILASSVFGLVGIGQFVASFRRRHPSWHRRMGWALAITGLVSAVSGLWMTRFFPRVEGDSDLLDLFRLVFGLAMVACLLLGLYDARGRRFQRHSAWMVRAYAIGMGAGTQVVLFIPWVMVVAPPDATARAWLLGAGWALNLTLVEAWIARGKHRRAHPAAAPMRDRSRGA